MHHIAQCDPKANYFSHRNEIDDAIRCVFNSGRYILGEQVAKFEQDFAHYNNAKFALGVANGTDAIELALRACSIGTGDAVVTVSHTAVATVSAIERTGAVPLFVDIDPATYTLSIESLADLLKKNNQFKIKAIIPVHLYGHPASMEEINKIAKSKDLYVIEDCAQAQGAKFLQTRVGSFGHLGAFSFYPTKNLGCLGDGGAVVTNDGHLYERLRSLREYGWKERFISVYPGINSRLDEIQAAILNVKLKHLDAENSQRVHIADSYTRGFLKTPLIFPATKSQHTHVFHQYVVRLNQRDKIRAVLQEKGIWTLIHYPVPIHLQPAYAGRIPSLVSLRETETVCQEILSLPIYPEMKREDVERVIQTVNSLLNRT